VKKKENETINNDLICEIKVKYQISSGESLARGCWQWPMRANLWAGESIICNKITAWRTFAALAAWHLRRAWQNYLAALSWQHLPTSWHLIRRQLASENKWRRRRSGAANGVAAAGGSASGVGRRRRENVRKRLQRRRKKKKKARRLSKPARVIIESLVSSAMRMAAKAES